MIIINYSYYPLVTCLSIKINFSVGSIGGPHSNDTRSGTPSGMGGGMQRQLSSDGLERPPSMGAGSCKDEGNIFIIVVENFIIILNSLTIKYQL